jgi:tRNA pseudouridine55 synthase
MYSALKVGGKKLCDLAREGKEIEREARDITIHSITAKRVDERRYTLDVHCSKGTYIRTLCADIGKKLGTGGVMETLERTKASVFTLRDAKTVSELEAMSESERKTVIYPIEYVFADLEKVYLEPFFARLARCGVEIYLKKIGLGLPEGTRVTIFDEYGFFALGEVRKFDTGLAIKPIKQFDV